MVENDIEFGATAFCVMPLYVTSHILPPGSPFTENTDWYVCNIVLVVGTDVEDAVVDDEVLVLDDVEAIDVVEVVDDNVDEVVEGILAFWNDK